MFVLNVLKYVEQDVDLVCVIWVVLRPPRQEAHSQGCRTQYRCPSSGGNPEDKVSALCSLLSCVDAPQQENSRDFSVAQALAQARLRCPQAFTCGRRLIIVYIYIVPKHSRKA